MPGSLRGRLSALLVGAMIIFVTSCSTTITDDSPTRIGTADVSSRLTARSSANTLILDARQPSDFQAGHIPGAVNLRLEDFSGGRAPALSRYSTIIVYGQNPGSASAIALSKRLMSLGYSGVRLFEGGMDAWTAAGQTVDRHNPDPLRVDTSPVQPEGPR